MTDVYIGELTEYTQQHWIDMDDPFEVLEKDNKAGIGLNWIEFMAWANTNLKKRSRSTGDHSHGDAIRMI